MDITVKDFSGRVIGYIIDTGGGNKTVKDSGFRVLGYYDSSKDVVLDDCYRVVARGNAPGILFKL